MCAGEGGKGSYPSPPFLHWLNARLRIPPSALHESPLLASPPPLAHSHPFPAFTGPCPGPLPNPLLIHTLSPYSQVPLSELDRVIHAFPWGENIEGSDWFLSPRTGILRAGTDRAKTWLLTKVSPTVEKRKRTEIMGERGILRGPILRAGTDRAKTWLLTKVRPTWAGHL